MWWLFGRPLRWRHSDFASLNGADDCGADDVDDYEVGGLVVLADVVVFECCCVDENVAGDVARQKRRRRRRG